LLTLFTKHFHIQVAVGFDPVLVDFDCQCPNEPQAPLLIRKEWDDMSAVRRFSSWLIRSSILVLLRC
jgi:hypothetical protein